MENSTFEFLKFKLIEGNFPKNENEIIIGAKDKHLTFHVSLFCSDVKDKTQEVSITTIVKYENILGRIYFAAIWLFHRIIVSYLFKRAIKIHNT